MKPVFAESSGISSLGINLKGFLFQLITFVIVLLILRRYVFPKLVATLENRRKTLEESLVQAKATEEALAKAEGQAEDILAKARIKADEALAEAKKAADAKIAEAETAAADRAAAIVKDAEEHLAQERAKLHEDLRAELAGLVADATAKVVEEKVDAKRDSSIIERAIRSIAG